VRVPATPASVLLGTASIDNPRVFNEPAAGLPNVRDNFNSSNIYQQGVNVGDTVKFNEAWSARLAVSQDWIKVANYNAAGAVLPGYKDDGASPSASLMFKPSPETATYVSFANSLQAGDIAPGTAANSGASLSPYRSKSIEVGAKASLAKLDLTAAIFRIERPFANIDPSDSVFKITGDQVNRGVEFTAVGELMPHLVVYGGVTFLDAKLEGTGNPATDGKKFVGQPKYKGNVLLEYRVPALAGLVAVFDWQFSARRPGNDTNTFEADGYNTFDIGVRYAMKAWDHALTWRLTMNNVTDEHYWSTIAPSNLTGANTGNLIAHLGSPRTVSASVSLDF
jgi:iron complex outermembrane receptor protein